MMTINFDTITNNYEVIYVIITVMKYYLKKIDGSTFICWRHTWRDLVYEYSWAKSPMISGYVEVRKRRGHIFFEWNKCLWSMDTNTIKKKEKQRCNNKEIFIKIKSFKKGGLVIPCSKCLWNQREILKKKNVMNHPCGFCR